MNKSMTPEQRDEAVQKTLSMVRWIVCVTFVLLIGNLIRGEQINDNVDRGKTAASDAEDAATRAAIASERASKDLTEAIKASSDPEALKRTLEAFENLNVSKEILCLEFPTTCEEATQIVEGEK